MPTASAPSAGEAFFPLDEQLGLLPGSLTPRLHERLTLLGSLVPSFRRAATLLATLTGATVSEPTARRKTEQAGGAGEAVERAERERLEREMPVAPAAPEKQFLSVDGVFVPLVGGEWAQARTLVIGRVGEAVPGGGEAEARCEELSYYCRLMDAETFTEAALVEVHRRGVENAGQVGVTVDGAAWCQGFVDDHRPDAVRILDFPHAGERLGQAGSLLFGEGTATAKEWVSEQLHHLKHQGPHKVLAELRRRSAVAGTLLGAEPAARLSEQLTYLEKRADQMDYPCYRAAGWPIGSGAVESANKRVVQARLKGAGMHWARRHVNGMLVLRSALCSDRWEATWPPIERELRAQAQRTAARRRQGRRQRCDPAHRAVVVLTEAKRREAAAKAAGKQSSPGASGADRAEAEARSPTPPRPHPWRRFNPNWLTPPRTEYAKL